MISSIHELRKALKGSNPQFRGVILWQGASLLDGAPIAVIANRIMNKSKNEKTGAMVQSFIIRTDIHPTDALKSGADASICGQCKHRPALYKAAGASRCYVQVSKSVASVYKALHNGRYARAGIDFDAKLLPELFEGLAFRIGTYGDPAAAPFQVWRAATLKVAFKNGYTHQWQDKRFGAFKLLCMASADSAAETALAHASGWRTFHVLGKGESLTKGIEISCPASKEAGFKTDCASCKACGGLSAKAKVSIAIMAH